MLNAAMSDDLMKRGDESDDPSGDDDESDPIESRALKKAFSLLLPFFLGHEACLFGRTETSPACLAARLPASCLLCSPSPPVWACPQIQTSLARSLPVDASA